MKAVTYQGPRNMVVADVPDPRIEEGGDVILRITATAICGSDLHMYNGFMAPFMKHGDVMGHEFMGVVEEVGPEVRRLKKGDRVIIPFLIGCGSCYFCAKQVIPGCEVTNPDPGASLNRSGIRNPAALYGYSHLYGGTPGGQAELVRVRHADFNAYKVPDHLTDEQVLFLTDILPTGWQAVEQARIQAGDSVAILGAGPVGQMAALSAQVMGASRIYVVDDQPDRLAFAEAQYGAIPIHMGEVDDVASFIVERTDRRGVDATIDAVGFEAKGNKLESIARGLMIETGSGTVLRDCIAAVRRGGVVSIPGVYTGFLHGFLIGDAFDKGLTFAMGQTSVHRHLDTLLGHIEAGRMAPGQVITHRLPLAEAADGYRIFANKEDGCRKVVLYPGGVPAAA